MQEDVLGNHIEALIFHIDAFLKIIFRCYKTIDVTKLFEAIKPL